MKIPDFVIDRISRNQEDFMPQLSIIRRWANIGGGERERGIVATDVPTRYTAGWGPFRVVADRYQGITPYTITVPWDTDVRVDDEFVDEEARTFHIRSRRKPGSYITAVQLLGDLVND